jgi:XTP/dITP diphosphohydrolase
VGTAPRLARPRQTILVATHNRGKIAEILHRLEDLPLELKILDDLPDMPAPVEDGATFFANARKKALHYSRRTDLVVLSEDSGLAVDALDGAPGVRSARFGGSGATDADRIRLLLSKLDGVRWDYRTARFVCVAAVARQGEILASFEGQVEGRIAMEPTGSGGFGYDPVFIHEESGRSFADMTREEKGKVSHRGKALDQLALWLRGFMGEGPRKPHRPGPRRT